MQIHFIGSQDLGYNTLRAIFDSEHTLTGICSLNPASHEHWENRITPFAIEQGIPVRTFDDHLMLDENVPNINVPENIEMIAASEPDIIVVVGWRQIIGKKIRSIPKHGTIGVHYSLLPKYRGHAPIPWAIVSGDEEAGLSVFYLTSGADTGDILYQYATEIGLTDTSATVRERLDNVTPKVMVEVIAGLQNNTIIPVKQDEDLAVISGYRLPEFARIDWRNSSRQIYDEIRATTYPYTGAFAYYNGDKVTIWSADLLPATPGYVGYPGQILLTLKNDGIIVKTGDHALKICEIQTTGIDRMSADAYFKSTRGIIN
ncbi:methionyl-tRNA formyltransferase [Calditrichota bacterium]